MWFQVKNGNPNVTSYNNKQQNKNLAPLLGKQKWNSHSSQPTPRAAKSLALEPSSLFVEPEEKNPLMHHLLHYQIQSPSNVILLLLMDILLYSIFPSTWSFMILLLFSTQLGVLTYFLGMMLPAYWVLTQWLLPLFFSSCKLENTLKRLYPLLFPLQHILLNKNVLFLTFMSKIIK